MEEGFTVKDKRGGDGGDQPLAEEKKKEPNFVEQCFAEDILGPWFAANMFPNKYNIDRQTGLVINSNWSYVDHNLPWIMVNNDGTRECDFYKDVDTLHDIIPSPCRCCWKVVVMPKTLKQLFQLLQIEDAMAKADAYCYCKCGIELRQDVERNYGGYFYCNSLSQGLERLEQVRANVKANMEDGENVPVILKRGCTEYERKYGPSDKWDELAEKGNWDALFNRLLAVFKIDKQFHKQPLLVQKHIIMKWFAHATSIGDPTIPELNGGQKMYPGYVTYEMPKEKENA